MMRIPEIFSPNAAGRRREDAAASETPRATQPQNTNADATAPAPLRRAAAPANPAPPTPAQPAGRRAAPPAAALPVFHFHADAASSGQNLAVPELDFAELLTGLLGHMPPMMPEFVMPPPGFFEANGAPEMDEAGMADTMRHLEEAGETEHEQRFLRIFQAAHAGSVAAMKTLVDKLRDRDPASVPEGGITRENIDDRDSEIYYKLPALLLTELLPQVCEGRGTLRDVALFDYNWQKETAKGDENYASILPQLYVALRYLHSNDKEMMKAALPALVARLSHLVETGAEGSTANEKDLVTMIQDAAHHIDGHILSETLRKAHAHLDTST